MSNFLPQPGHNGWWILAFLHANFKYYVTDRDRSFWFEDVIFPKDPNILITTYFLSRETKCVYELMLFFIILGYVQNAALSEAHSDAPCALDCSSNISGPFLCKVLPVFFDYSTAVFLIWTRSILQQSAQTKSSRSFPAKVLPIFLTSSISFLVLEGSRVVFEF